MTLDEFEAQITALSSNGPPRLRPGERCKRLYDLQGELKRTLWSGPYQGWARELAARTVAAIQRIQDKHDLMGPVHAPRFPAFEDSAGNIHQAID